MTNTNTYPEKIKKFYKTVSQLLNEKSQKNKSKNQLKLKCMYTDAIIHDFSNSYEQEKKPLINEIKQLLSQTKEIESSPLLKIFGNMIRSYILLSFLFLEFFYYTLYMKTQFLIKI